MSQNYSDEHNESKEPQKWPMKWRNPLMLVILPLWVVAAFFLSYGTVIAIVWILAVFHVPIQNVNDTILNTIFAAIIYLFTLLIAISVPWLVRRYRTTLEELGLQRLPYWSDILLAPAGFVIYFIVTSIMILIVSQIFPGFNVNQPQNTGFNNLSAGYQYVLAFLTLVVLAPVAEETLFRGYLYGKLREYVPFWAAMLATSVLFGVAHGQWDLAIDTFSLSLVLCLLRESTGSIWSSILLHMIKNGIAFYLLFISPGALSLLK